MHQTQKESCIFQDDVLESFSGDEYRDEAVQAVSETLRCKDHFSIMMRARRFLPNCSIHFWISGLGNAIFINTATRKTVYNCLNVLGSFKGVWELGSYSIRYAYDLDHSHTWVRHWKEGMLGFRSNEWADDTGGRNKCR